MIDWDIFTKKITKVPGTNLTAVNRKSNTFRYLIRLFWNFFARKLYFLYFRIFCDTCRNSLFGSLWNFSAENCNKRCKRSNNTDDLRFIFTPTVFEFGYFQTFPFPSVIHIWNQLIKPVRTMYNMCCVRHRVALYKISMQIFICSVAPPGGKNQKSASIASKNVISRFYCKKNFWISGHYVAVATFPKF